MARSAGLGFSVEARIWPWGSTSLAGLTKAGRKAGLACEGSECHATAPCRWGFPPLERPTAAVWKVAQAALEAPAGQDRGCSAGLS